MRGDWKPGYWAEQKLDAALVERLRLVELNARPRVPKMPVVALEPVPPAVERPVSDGDLTPLKPPPKSSKEYLKRRLQSRVEIPATALFKDAAQYGFSPKMLRTAKNSRKIRVFQQDRAWWWLLTEDT
jgi:hypothetical protein